MPNKPIGLYSFVTECGTTILLEQFQGTNIRQATIAWHKNSSVKPVLDFLKYPEDLMISAITGMPGVWCTSGSTVEYEFFMTHAAGPLKLDAVQVSRRKPIYAFVNEKAGGTYIEQFSGLTVHDAMAVWFKRSITRPAVWEPELAVPIAGTTGAWFYSALDAKGVEIFGHVTGPLGERARKDKGPSVTKPLRRK